MCNNKHLLFCFPFAGGTADFYDDLEKKCYPNIHFIKLEYSGHGSRMKEPLFHSIYDVTNDLLPRIKRSLYDNQDCDYSLMGYSMGSIVAFDVLRRIREDSDIKNPENIFLSAHQPRPMGRLCNLPKEGIDEWVKNRTIEFGRVDKKLLNNRIFWRLYLPIFKADYEMIAKYDFESIHYLTQIPATVFYSEKDTPYEEMKEWRKFFIGECEFIEFTGSHFFIDNYCSDIADIIKKKTKGIYGELR